MEDLEGFTASHLNVPLLDLLQKCDAESASVDVRLWVRQRTQLGDIDKYDPSLKGHVLEIGVIECQLADRARTEGSMRLEVSLLEQKLDVAAKAMLKRQYDRAIELFPDKNARDTDFYKAHVETISKWKVDKLAPHLSAGEIYARVTAEIEDQLQKMIQAMVTAAKQDVEQPDVADQDLMSELTSLVEDKHGAGDKAGTHIHICIKYLQIFNLQVRIQKTTMTSSFMEMLPPGASPVAADL